MMRIGTDIIWEADDIIEKASGPPAGHLLFLDLDGNTMELDLYVERDFAARGIFVGSERGRRMTICITRLIARQEAMEDMQAELSHSALVRPVRELSGLDEALGVYAEYGDRPVLRFTINPPGLENDLLSGFIDDEESGEQIFFNLHAYGPDNLTLLAVAVAKWTVSHEYQIMNKPLRAFADSQCAREATERCGGWENVRRYEEERTESGGIKCGEVVCFDEG
jgi:hypothetical protein